MSSPVRRIFVAGSTGNTGLPCVRALSAAGSVEVVAMTRSADSATAKELAALPHVRVVEAVYSDPASLDRALAGCQRAYIACHNGTTHFHDESNFYAAAKRAGVHYVVKLATHNAFIGYTSRVYYGRVHLALEDWLEQMQLPYTSLRPNVFTSIIVGLIAQSVVNKGEFPAMMEGHAAAFIVPADVGEAAAALLLLDDPSPHYSQRYVMSGPEDVTDVQIQQWFEEARGAEQPKLRTVPTHMNDLLLPAFTASDTYAGEKESLPHSWPTAVLSDNGTLQAHPTAPALISLGAGPKRTVRDAVFEAQHRATNK